MADARYGGLPFKEAVDYFRQKVRLPTRTWTDIDHGMHTRAFVVAGATKDELLADFQEALGRVKEQGGTLEQFRQDFDRIVEKHGWQYNGGRNWRSRVIFETNLRTAYMAGRYKQMTDPDVLKHRPFWEYRHGDSRVPRPHHLDKDGLVLRADDPWWNYWYPPNGWGCKCKVFSLSKRDLARLGKDGPDQAPPLDLEQKRLGRDGPLIDVPQGIDPGWGYNVGEAAWGRSEALRLMEDEGPWTDLVARGRAFYKRAELVPADAPAAKLGARIAKGDETALRRALNRAIGGDAAEFVDPAGTTVRVTQAIVDHMLELERRQDGREAYFPFIRELVEDPFEIWINFARSEMSGRVALRRRYIKVIELEKDRALGLVAELDQGQWAALTMFRGNPRAVDGLRSGRLLWGRKE